MTKGDKILIITTIILSLAGLAFTFENTINSDQKYVVIKVDGERVKRISISEEEKNQIYDFQLGNGHTGYIEINDGAVRMLEMDKKICPKGICSNTGWISKKYQNIVCLPNKITVSFEQKKDDDLDIISY